MSRAAQPSLLPTRFVRLPSGRLAVLDIAATGGPPRRPVLLVPGYTGSKEDFLPVLDTLAAAGHRVVAVDQRGQYESDGPEDPEAYTTDRLGTDLLSLVATLGLEPAHLVGHSFGGLVARAAVLASPRSWASLTLLDSGPAALSGSRSQSTRLLSEAAAAVPLDQLWQGVTAHWAAQGHAPVGAEGFQRERFSRTRAAAYVGMGAALLGEPDRVGELRATARAAGLTVSVVYGEDDDAWLPAEQSAMAERLGVAPVVVPGAAHSPAWEAPAATAAALLAAFEGRRRAG